MLKMGSLEESATMSRSSCSGGSVKICDDVWAEILCRSPEKPLVQFKCVCKAWHRLISKVCLPRALPASLPLAGLYFPTYTLPHDLPLITIKSPRPERAHFHRRVRMDNDNKSIHYTSLEPHNSNIISSSGSNSNNSSGGFDQQQSMNEFLDSCNGLLLFVSGYECRYLVCNPMTRECVLIPRASIHKRRFYAALAFNPSESPSYKVVRFAFVEVEEIVLDIYSSDTGQWVRRPVQLDSNVFRLPWIKHSVYFGGALYRLCKTWHLLRFDLNEVIGCAAAIDLPKRTRRERMGCIGVSMGNLFYAEANCEELLVWSLDGIPEPMEWTQKYYLYMPVLRLYLGLFRGHASEHILWLEPCSFHPNEEIIFLATPLKIMSCSLKVECFEVKYETRDGEIIHGCFRPSFTYLRLLVSLDHLGKIRCIPNKLETMCEGSTVLSLEEPFNDQEGIQVQMPKLSLMINGNNVK